MDSSFYDHSLKVFLSLDYIQEARGETAVPALTHSHWYLFIKTFYLFILAAPGLSCSIQDLVPGPGIEPGPLALGCGVSATGPAGESLSLIFKREKTSRLLERSSDALWCLQELSSGWLDMQGASSPRLQRAGGQVGFQMLGWRADKLLNFAQLWLDWMDS